jgi:aminoglycoside 3-N-acetyltransferase
LVTDLRGLKVDAIEWLKARWLSAGIESGDVVLLHSNIVRTLGLLKRNGYKPSVDVILESFIQAVDENGTLLFPLFNFDFTSGVTFDVRTTKSHMGALTEAARNHPEAVRTGHPIYSFCAIGALANKFEALDNVSGYGVDSPFGMLRELDGKVVVLDIIENNSMTFHHHVEEMMLVSYRYMKNFKADYVDQSGYKKEKSYSIYVRDLDKNVETELEPIGEKLWEASIYKGDRPNNETGLRVARANAIFDYVSKVIAQGNALGNLYKIGA